MKSEASLWSALPFPPRYNWFVFLFCFISITVDIRSLKNSRHSSDLRHDSIKNQIRVFLTRKQKAFIWSEHITVGISVSDSSLLQVELWFISGFWSRFIFHWDTSPWQLMCQTVNNWGVKAWDCPPHPDVLQLCCVNKETELTCELVSAKALRSDYKHWNLMLQFEDHEPCFSYFFTAIYNFNTSNSNVFLYRKNTVIHSYKLLPAPGAVWSTCSCPLSLTPFCSFSQVPAADTQSVLQTCSPT